MKTTTKTIRCAIYTRKSTEEGLEQDFNSLDAQREACEAYIKSQQHEGWVLIEKHYDDGGFSGGTLDRPAVKKLFKDIEAGEVDIVVVYKVDRLTRSLMDFSKIVDLFDKQNASFVSITQHFNTTTSMGRLTLNILLSFAQFEREVTGERIRDKIAASKKKGMWMGGRVPLGYDLSDKKLIIDNSLSKTVKIIFEKYIELKSVVRLKEYLDNSNLRSRSGKPFSKGNLYKILANKIYMGKIAHKGNIYDGEHDALIESADFAKVQDILLCNRVDNKLGTKTKSRSLLAGKIFDDNNNKMTPTYSNTRKRKYRYYVSQSTLKNNKTQSGSVDKIPAGEIDNFVIKSIKEFLMDTTQIQKYINDYELVKQKEILNTLKNMQNFSDPKLIRSILAKVIISTDSVEFILCENTFRKTIDNLLANADLTSEAETETDSPIKIIKQVEITKTSQSGNVLIMSTNEKPTPNPNPYLINAIVKSHYWNKLLLEGKVKSTKEIQELEGQKDPTYVRDILNLKFLPLHITEQVINGTQSRDLSVQKLFNFPSYI